MSVLSESQKKAVPEKQQGLPEKEGTGSYPMPDRKHAAVAKSYAKRFATPEQQKRINSKADKILGKKMSVLGNKAKQYGASTE